MQFNLLSIECDRRRYRILLNCASVANINNPQMSVWIFWTGRWISYRSRFWKWCTTKTVHSHNSTGIKPGINHRSNICIVEWSIHNMRSIVWAPNCFRCCKYFLCIQTTNAFKYVHVMKIKRYNIFKKNKCIYFILNKVKCRRITTNAD